MIIRDFKDQFNATVPLSENFLALMKDSFVFYAQLCNDFYQDLAVQVQANTLEGYLQKLQSQLFEPKYCDSLEERKKQFLAEHIKLEEFQQKTQYRVDFLNDLEGLKKVGDRVYQLLQRHWELYRYEKSAANSQSLIEFILEIDSIGISWDSYLEKYLAVSKVLHMAGGEAKKEGFEVLAIKYHLLEGEETSLEMLLNFFQFLQLAYEFIVKLHKEEELSKTLEIFHLEASNPMSCILFVPIALKEGFAKFLHYLSVDVIKKETLLKYVMEVVRVEQGKDIPKPVIVTFQKKLAKQIELLPSGGYLSTNQHSSTDNVEILSALCAEMDQLKIQYKDILIGSTAKLAVNRGESSEKKNSPVITPTIPPSGPKNNEAKVMNDLDNKEHVGFLTG